MPIRRPSPNSPLPPGGGDSSEVSSLSSSPHSNSWSPLGAALEDYQNGDRDAALQVFFESGDPLPLPAAHFFRTDEEMSDAEALALELCIEPVLDIGAGAGCHSLILQRQGLQTTAMDICPQTVAVMASRGVQQPVLADVAQDPQEGVFQTLLLLMNGIGLVGTLSGLGQFLHQAQKLLGPGGQILFDSSDLRRIKDPDELKRMTNRTAAGMYFGETWQQLEYKARLGNPFPWLYVDQETLQHQATLAGWHCQIVFEQEDGAYLARLQSLA